MRRFFCILCLLGISILQLAAQGGPTRYVSATELTIVGKLFPDTPNPYHRIDTVRFKGFTPAENIQVRESAGMAIAFRTNSPYIKVNPVFGYVARSVNTMGIAVKGFDLYIRQDGKWLWAAADAQRPGKEKEPITLISGMDGQLHECLLYLPLLSELYSLEIGVQEGCVLEAVPNPFRHRIAIFGSSFTHGISTSRSGMAYPAQFSRATGLQLLSLGCSGNCKLQPYFADALAAVDADAFIFDTFSNPTAGQVKERLFPFIEKLQSAHPGKPLIFQKTNYREKRNFNTAEELKESTRSQVVDSLMRIACKRYKDVYFIETSATAPSHETSVDGTHPDNYGYSLWAKSIEKRVCRNLKKYGIK